MTNISGWNKELHESLQIIKEAVKSCDGRNTVYGLWHVTTAVVEIPKEARRETLKTVESFANEFKNNCHCINIKDTKQLVYDYKLPPMKDKKLQKSFDDVKNRLIEQAKTCNCGEIISLMPLYVLSLYRQQDEIYTKNNYKTWDRKTWRSEDREKSYLILDAIFGLNDIFEPWDDHCVCHRKGAKTFSNAGGRYKK